MDMVFLYNEDLFFPNRLKKVAKKFLGKNFGGPNAVFSNLEYGLKQIGQPLVVNNDQIFPIPAAGVVNGASVLKWAIEQKNIGKIGKILAGPNIGMPKEHGGIIFHDAIDCFLVPSLWAKEFCLSFKPEFASRIKIWAAGVKTLPEATIIKISHGRALIYQKNADQILLESIKKTLKAKSIPFDIIEYGKYNQEQYYRALRSADFMIFLSASESQGLALHEAWMMNVPTLVWSGGHMKNGEYEWKNSSSAPYLTPECGMFFPSGEAFALTLNQFLEKLPGFTPRQHHLNNFTPEITAKKYLEILSTL